MRMEGSINGKKYFILIIQFQNLRNTIDLKIYYN